MSPKYIRKNDLKNSYYLGEKNLGGAKVFVVSSRAEIIYLNLEGLKRKIVEFYIFFKEVVELSYKLDKEDSFLVARKASEEII